MFLTYVYIYAYLYAYVYIHVYVYIYMCVYTYKYIYVKNQDLLLGMYSTISFLVFKQHFAKMWQQNKIQYNCLRNLCNRFSCLSKIVCKVGEHVLILYQNQSTGKPMSQVIFRQVIHSLGVEQNKNKKKQRKKITCKPLSQVKY